MSTPFPDPPPLEAYSRVTDPERFAPLHPLALDLLERLEAEYEVRRTTASEAAGPSVTLTPAARRAAPVSVAFTPFPGLVVRCGHWLEDRFPSCGCDACRESADGEGERLRWTIGEVVAGRFAEEVRVPLLRSGSRRWWLGAPDRRASSGGWERLSRAGARALRGDRPARVEWEPWTRRATLPPPR